MVNKIKDFFKYIYSFSEEFHHELLTITARWNNDTSLVEVVKAIVERIDKPDIDYSKNPGLFFFD
jgi:hypothetical protein